MQRLYDEVAKAEETEGSIEKQAIALLIEWYIWEDGCAYAWRNDYQACSKSGGYNSYIEGQPKGPWCRFCKTEELLQSLGICPDKKR